MTEFAMLSISNISRAFPGVQALDNVTFSVGRGSIHALVGANGAGKSTLMKILSGALAPDLGEIKLEGETYHPTNPKDAIKAGISTIYQELNLLLLRSVVQNIIIGREPARFRMVGLCTSQERCSSGVKTNESGAYSSGCGSEWIESRRKADRRNW